MFMSKLFRIPAYQNLRNFSLGTRKQDFVRSSTVDQHEIDHHKQYADVWWDVKHGPMKPLHSMNDLRVPLVRTGLINTGRLKEDEVQLSTQYLKGIKILDIGCGGGILSIPLSRLGAEVTGLDPSSELTGVAMKEAQARLPEGSQIEFVTGTIEEFSPQNKEKFDAIVLSEVIEHITKKEEFIQICVDTLKPDGSIFLTTINRTMASWMLAIVAAEYVLNLLPRGTHDWEKFPTAEEIKKYFEQAGCKPLLTCGMFYQPWTNQWSWVSNTSVNYVVHAVKHM